MNEYDKMISGKLYIASKPELLELSLKGRKLLDKINETSHTNFEERATIAKELFGSVGKNININKPFYCDYGANIHVGDNFYSNFDCVMLDVNKINIGNNVMFAARVSVYTAAHPIDAEVRNTTLEFGLEINIGNNVWVGGSTVINPGVTIGDNVVIGSGSVVTKDIPSNVVAAGNPARVLREITEEDKIYWNQQKDLYYSK